VPWSVFRVCSKKEEFDRYGGTSGGVVGWFNPGTKELVVFNGTAMMGSGGTETVTFHEGWHQYCDSYFGTELQRWFDEGHGDFFGSYELKGNRWVYSTSKMRRVGLMQQVARGTFEPWKNIVFWNKDKFYGPKAVTYYEQGYGMVAFLRHGPKTRYWKKQWDNILPTYIEVARSTQDQKKAVEAAFAQVNFDELQEAWVQFCKKEL